jgi:hypothetical protein
VATNPPPGGSNEKPNAAKGPAATKIKRPKYIKLKTPSDVMAYVQRLVNRLRENDQEIEQLGKITNLLNTWIAAHKDQVETEDMRRLQDEIDMLKKHASPNIAEGSKQVERKPKAKRGS